jgi:hypothetical protein
MGAACQDTSDEVSCAAFGTKTQSGIFLAPSHETLTLLAAKPIQTIVAINRKHSYRSLCSDIT